MFAERLLVQNDPIHIVDPLIHHLQMFTFVWFLMAILKLLFQLTSFW